MYICIQADKQWGTEVSHKQRIQGYMSGNVQKQMKVDATAVQTAFILKVSNTSISICNEYMQCCLWEPAT